MWMKSVSFVAEKFEWQLKSVKRRTIQKSKNGTINQSKNDLSTIITKIRIKINHKKRASNPNPEQLIFLIRQSLCGYQQK